MWWVHKSYLYRHTQVDYGTIFKIVFITAATDQVQVMINNVNDNKPEITTESMKSIKNTNVGDNEGKLDVDLNMFWFALTKFAIYDIWIEYLSSNFNTDMHIIFHSRRLLGSTNQADPSCFYFRISWILMERHWFYFCRASEASNIDCFKTQVWKFWTKNSNSSLKNRYFGVLIFLEREFFDP